MTVCEVPLSLAEFSLNSLLLWHGKCQTCWHAEHMLTELQDHHDC